jgi:O-antigen ligase
MPNFQSLLPGANWQHPNPRLQRAWNSARIGFVVFPLLPIVGVFLIFASLVQTWQQCWREIIKYPLNRGFGLLSIWLIIGSLFGLQPGDAALGLANFIPFFIFFAAYSILIQSPEQLRQLAGIFLIPAVPIMLLGLLQLAGTGAIISIPGNLVSIWEIARGGNPLGRMSSVFSYANSLAAYLQMVFIVTIGLLADLFEQRSMIQGKSSCWKSLTCWLLLSILGLCAGSLILTSSRGAWTAAIFGSLVFAVHQGWYWILGMMTTITTIVLSAAYVPAPLQEPLRLIVPRYLWGRINDNMYPNQPEALGRLAQWKFAWDLTKSRPLTGWGLQSFGPLYQKHSHIWLGYPHNLILMLSSNLGVPATISLVGLVGWVLYQSTELFLAFPIQWRSDRTILFTYLVAFAGFMIFNITDVTALELRLNTHAWLILSGICGVFYQSRTSE